jgi:integrase
MRDLSPALCEKYVSDLENGGMNADTVNKHIDLLGLIWKTVDPTWRNPWTGLHSTRQHTAEHYRRLSLAECQTLYKAAEGDLRVLILLGFSTGQRLGDLATLKWSQVDMKEKIITLIPSKTDKRKAPEVQIPMTDQLYNTLEALPKDVFVMPEVAIMYKTNGTGLSKRISALMDDNKVTDNKTGRAAFHSFRGTFASMIGDSGANLQIEAYLTSHALPGVTGIYSHPAREVLRKWVKKAIPKL